MSWVYRVHKWASLLVGMQLLIWLLTGLYFNVADDDKTSGNTYRNTPLNEPVLLKRGVLPMSSVLRKYPDTIEAELIYLAQQPFYLLHSNTVRHAYQLQQVIRVNPYTGDNVGEITRQQAVAQAEATYNGPGNVISTQRLSPPYQDIVREENPVWRIQFNDALNTRVYIHAITGTLIRHANDPYQIRDLMYMLHFMDYFDSGGFNNVFLKMFSLLALLLSLSGAVWLIKLLLEGKFRFIIGGRKHKWRYVDNQNVESQLLSAPQENILSALLRKGVRLPSECGGGGQCGRCQVIAWPCPDALEQEVQLLTPEQLNAGHRLACQHLCRDVREVRLLAPTAETFQLTLVSKKYLSAFVVSLTFKSHQHINYKAGAHMQFAIPACFATYVPIDLPEHFKKAWQEYSTGIEKQSACFRNYSIANAQNSDNSVSFLIRLHPAKQDENSHPVTPPGRGSMYMSALQVGDVISATGPYDPFSLKGTGHSHLVFIGGGSGMAPLRAMIEQLLLAEIYSSPVTLIQGARRTNELFYHRDFERWNEWFTNFSYQTICSRMPPDGDDCGYVQSLIQRFVVRQRSQTGWPTAFQFYLCGPAQMMEEVKNILICSDVSPSAIFTDQFLFSTRS